MRHGSTEWNAAGRFMSRTDLPLSHEGFEELERSLAVVRAVRPTVVVTSPAVRCRQTADVALEALSLKKLDVWSELVEIDFGSFEGHTFNQLVTGPQSQLFNSWLDPSSESLGSPGGESWEAVHQRSAAVIRRLEGLGEDALVISHGYFIRAILIQALVGLPPRNLRSLELANGSISAISNRRGYWRLEFHNSASLFV